MIKHSLSLAALLGLSSCGLRGDLERPPPIFLQPPTAEAKIPVDRPAVYTVANVDSDKIYLNSFGGEIPKPAPEVPVMEETMDDFPG
jgi:predicted small lipoprotein YifL